MDIIKRLFLGLIILISICYTVSALSKSHTAAAASSGMSVSHYYPVIDIAQYAIHQGDSRSANLIEGWIPLYPRGPQNLVFTDARFYNPNGTPVEWNIDFGFRRLFHQNTRLFGIYGGYDRFRSETSRYYSQLHAGLEYWYKRFFVGGNGYLPVGTKVYDNDAANAAALVPTPISYRFNISYAPGKERILPGGDAEIGYDFTHGLTLYAGGYYFDHSDTGSISGPKARATYTFYRAPHHHLLGIFDRIRLEGLISHDSVRGTSWLLGLRLRFGLPSRVNPTQGVTRHMTDTVRRDLNVVSENFNDPGQLYLIDGRPARADLVSNTSGRTIDDAVAGDADIIGIIGSQSATGVLTVGSRDLTVTGGEFSFTVDGRPYRIATVGNNGSLINFAGANTFTVVDPDGTHNIALQYFTFNSSNVSTSQFAVQTDGNSFGQITVDHIVSNEMPFDFRLAVADATGIVSFTHNTLNLSNSTAIDPAASATLFSGVIFSMDLASQKITIPAFSNNNISAVNRTVNNNSMSSLTIANSGLAEFTNGMLNNTFTASNNDTGFGWANRASTIINSGNIIGNKFIVSNVNAGTAWEGDNAQTTINGNITNNVFTTLNNGTTIGLLKGSTNSFTLNGDFRNNIFNASGNTSFAYGCFILGQTFSINGNITSNTFNVFNNADGIGFLISAGGNRTINGNVNKNNFNMNNNQTNNFGISILSNTGETTTFDKAISGNRFLTNGSLTGNYGFNLDATGGGTINFNGNSSQNELSTSNNNASIQSAGSNINYNG